MLNERNESTSSRYSSNKHLNVELDGKNSLRYNTTKFNIYNPTDNFVKLKLHSFSINL